MKRYSLGVDWNSTGLPEPCAKEMSAGRFILFDDHAALLRAVAKEVGKMRHDRECFAHTLISDGPFTMKWIIDDAQCNCPLGKVLAMLEVE